MDEGVKGRHLHATTPNRKKHENADPVERVLEWEKNAADIILMLEQRLLLIVDVFISGRLVQRRQTANTHHEVLKHASPPAVERVSHLGDVLPEPGALLVFRVRHDGQDIVILQVDLRYAD